MRQSSWKTKHWIDLEMKSCKVFWRSNFKKTIILLSLLNKMAWSTWTLTEFIHHLLFVTSLHDRHLFSWELSARNWGWSARQEHRAQGERELRGRKMYSTMIFPSLSPHAWHSYLTLHPWCLALHTQLKKCLLCSHYPSFEASFQKVASILVWELHLSSKMKLCQ